MDSTRQGIRRKTAEHNGVNRADSCAGKHRDCRLRDHRHVDRDTIAFFRADLFQCIGKLANPLVQFAVGDRQVAGRIITFPDDRNIIAFGFEMTVDTVVAGIQGTVVIPADVQIVLGVRNVFHFGERVDPVDARCLLRPESLVVFDRPSVHVFVASRIDMGARGELGRHFMDIDVVGLAHAVSLLLLLPMAYGAI